MCITYNSPFYIQVRLLYLFKLSCTREYYTYRVKAVVASPTLLRKRYDFLMQKVRYVGTTD